MQTGEITQEAKAVLTNPERFCDEPGQYQWSWAVLKAERGQTVHFHRLPAPAHKFIRPNGTLARIRNHIAAKGYSTSPAGVPNLGGRG